MVQNSIAIRKDKTKELFTELKLLVTSIMNLTLKYKWFLKLSISVLVYIFCCILLLPDKERQQEHRVSQLKKIPSVYTEKVSNNSYKDETDNVKYFTKNLTEPSKKKFYVWSSQCKMPYVEPFTTEVLKMFRPYKYEDCSIDEDLVTTIFDHNLGHYVLHIHEDVGRKLLNVSDDDFSCCYKEIERITDHNVRLLDCKDFQQNYIVPQHINGIIVQCHSKQNSSLLLQEDAFAFVQYQNVPNNILSPDIRQPSVLMIGIDSMSRINIRRSMPNTFAFLNRNNWYEMEGYNKIDDNTFPNLMAILTGYNLTSATNICRPEEVGGLDQCPFVWKQFKAAGYYTSYGEDQCAMSTFTYLKNGFEHPPVDYYLHPFMLAVDSNLKAYDRFGLHYCLGRRHSAAYVYDYCQQFASRYSQEPIFGLFWTNSFSHMTFESAASMDLKMLEYLENFEKFGILDKSIVIFFSDHGMRKGALNDLPEGFLEERLPMLFIWLPYWFRIKYPEYARALHLNRNRLTSPYDLHMTLKHIIEISSMDLQLPSAPDCPTCQSMLRLMPGDRSCEDAGITEHWCTCIPYEVVTKEKYARNITNLIIDKMNAYLSAKNLTSLCSNLTLKTINVAERKLILDEVSTNDVSIEQTYRIKFKTNSNSGSFQATADYNEENHTIKVDVESISRLTEYENDSKCVNDKQAKKYCFCQT